MERNTAQPASGVTPLLGHSFKLSYLQTLTDSLLGARQRPGHQPLARKRDMVPVLLHGNLAKTQIMTCALRKDWGAAGKRKVET